MKKKINKRKLILDILIILDIIVLLISLCMLNLKKIEDFILPFVVEKIETQPRPEYVGRVRLEGELATVMHGERLDKELDLVPDNVLKSFFNNGGEITLTSYDIATTYYKDTSLGDISGIFMGKDNKIYISHRMGSIRRATLHEFGHYVNKILGYICDSPEFKKIFNEEKDKFFKKYKDEHSVRNSSEFFAEVFSVSILNPKECKKYAPKSHQFITNIIKNI